MWRLGKRAQQILNGTLSKTDSPPPYGEGLGWGASCEG